MKPSFVVFLHSHRYDRLYQAMSLVLTASSMGWPCHLFLFYGALASYMNDTWNDVNIATGPDLDWADTLQTSFEQGSFPSLYEMLGKAREGNGGVHIYACSASCKTLDLDTLAVRDKVDEVVGLPTMLQISENAKHLMYI